MKKSHTHSTVACINASVRNFVMCLVCRIHMPSNPAQLRAILAVEAGRVRQYHRLDQLRLQAQSGLVIHHAGRDQYMAMRMHVIGVARTHAQSSCAQSCQSESKGEHESTLQQSWQESEVPVSNHQPINPQWRSRGCSNGLVTPPTQNTRQ